MATTYVSLDVALEHTGTWKPSLFNFCPLHAHIYMVSRAGFLHFRPASPLIPDVTHCAVLQVLRCRSDGLDRSRCCPVQGALRN